MKVEVVYEGTTRYALKSLDWDGYLDRDGCFTPLLVGGELNDNVVISYNPSYWDHKGYKDCVVVALAEVTTYTTIPIHRI